MALAALVVMANLICNEGGFSFLVGFSEEIIWRGYVQTRMIAYGGKVRGLLATSLLFAILWHFPVESYAQSGAILNALVNALTRFAPSLLFGYLMQKSQNVLPSSIFHLFMDWAPLLWGLSL
jgi:membrane protease YdiL (CAAX protease family)